MIKHLHIAGDMNIHLHLHGQAANDSLAAKLAMPVEVAPAPTTGLEWSHTLLDGEKVNYEKAEKAVAELGDGWRLPTREELLTLVDLTCHDPCIDTDKYPDTKSGYYWTSSECAWNKDEARWVVGFYYGSVLGSHLDYYACVRAVRASQ